MTILKHELKQGSKSFWIWTACIASLMMLCVFMFPQMKESVDQVSEMYASMGSFTEAFGMDRLSLGTLVGFYAVECGNIVGLGGAMFAALIAITSLSKEEIDHTAEFLYTHPISRTKVLTEKLMSVILQIVLMNAVIYLLSILSIVMIGETIPWQEISLLHLSYVFLHIEIAGICFGISAFLHRGGVGIGLGLACMLYFLNIIANLSKDAEFLKYITPFGYTEGADIVSDLSLNSTMILLGMGYMLVCILAGYLKYNQKDIL